MSTIFFTVVARNYVSYARVLCQSIRDNYPDVKIYVAISDSNIDVPNIDVLNCETLSLDQLNLPDKSSFVLRYSVMELSTAIKPYVFKWIFSNTSATKIIYLDPDILVLSPLTKVMSLLVEGTSIVLTPHILGPLKDDYLPNEGTMLRVGVYNLGFIAAFKCDEAIRLINWWADRLEFGAVVDLANGLFTDQKWADLMPSLFDGVKLLRSPGYNLAYWNLMQREVKFENGKWFANNEIISFVHFSGIDPTKPELFSKHQDRFLVSDLGEFKVVFEYYIKLLLDNGYKEIIKIPYSYKIINGVQVEGAIRTYFKLFLDNSKRDPLYQLSISYFNELEDRIPKNTTVSRYMYGLYLSRPDLKEVFNLDLYDGRLKFCLWILEYKNRHLLANAEFLITLKKRMDTEDGYNLIFKLKLIFMEYFLRCGFFIWRRLPDNLRYLLLRFIPFKSTLRIKNHLASYKNFPTPSEIIFFQSIAFFKKLFVRNNLYRQKNAISLYGYLSGDFGIAENLRSIAGSLQKNKYIFDVVEIDPGSLYNKSATKYDAMISDTGNHNIELYCINADQIPLFLSPPKLSKNLNKYRIGYWFWELSNFPIDWLEAFDYVDEIWVPTNFIQETVSKATNKPVIHIPVAVEFDISRNYHRKEFGLPNKDFLYLFSYDFHSFSSRKNPRGVLKAFLEEFDKSGENVGLVIKTIYGEHHSEDFNALLELTRGDDRIHVINKGLSRDEMYGLIGVCDCYVSLHRSEGFGLGMAEAMYLGKPVIGTGYSGNLDFMNTTNSGLVDFELISVGYGEYPHANGQVWANPSIKNARVLMRKVFSDQNFRERIAGNGKATIMEYHSFQRVGGEIVKRLSEIRRARG